MTRSAAKSKDPKTLADYCPVEGELKNGLFAFQGIGGGFFFRIGGVDTSFYTESEWNILYETWRSVLRLQNDEELQIVFSKRGNLEGLINQKFEELKLVRNRFTRKLFLFHLNEILKSIGGEYADLYTTEIWVCYRRQFKSSAKRQAALSELTERRFGLQKNLEQSGLKVEQINENVLFSNLARLANGGSYVPGDELADEWPSIAIRPNEVRINNQLFRSMLLKKLPESFSEMGMMHHLLNLQFPFDLAIRFSGKDHEPLRKQLERKKKVLFGLKGGKPAGDADLENQFQEVDDILRRLSDHNDALLQTTFVIGLRASSENEILLRKGLSEILGVQTQLGHLQFEETSLSTFDCFLETLPGFKGETFSAQTLLASNAVHFLPFFEHVRGHSRPVTTYRTRHGELFSIDPTDRQLANYNWLISGTSGAGKSFFVNSLISQSMSLSPRVFIIDIGGSYTKLTRFLGGENIGLDVRQGFKMGPFFMEFSADPAEEKRRREHTQIIFWEMLRDEGRLPTVEERAFLSEALEQFFTLEKLPEHPIAAVRDRIRDADRPESKRLSLLLDRWCYPSFYGDFLDHAESLCTDSQMITFDLKGLSEFEDLARVVQLIVCSSVWGRIRRDTTRFTYIVLDEVAFSLLKTQPHFVDELVSTVRKYNAAAILIAQDLEKITSNSAGASILQNAQIKAILQQRGDSRNYAEPLGLGEAELSAIASLERRKGSFSDIFLMIDDRKTVIRFVPNSLEYYLGTSVPHENRYLEERLGHYEGSFQEKMLKFVENNCQ